MSRLKAELSARTWFQMTQPAQDDAGSFCAPFKTKEVEIGKLSPITLVTPSHSLSFFHTRMYKHSWGAHSFIPNFFIFHFPPSKHSVLHLTALS